VSHNTIPRRASRAGRRVPGGGMTKCSKETRRAVGVRCWLACGLLGLLLGGWAGSVEPAPDLARPIPQQPLAAALAEFAHQSRLQLIYVSTIVRSRTSRDLPAGLAPKDALARLLEGTGLSFEFLNARTVRIFETPAVTPGAPSGAAGAPKLRSDDTSDLAKQPVGIATLEDVVITAERRSESISTVPMSI